MAINATTPTSFEIWAPQHYKSAEQQARVVALIPVVSRQIERYIGHELEVKERTEDYSLKESAKVVLLRNFPVLSVAEIEFNEFSEFEGTGSDDFNVTTETDTGLMHMRDPLGAGANVLRVRYTAGLGTDDSAIVTNYPEIAHAANTQLAYMLERRINPGARRDVSAAGGASFTNAYDLLKAVKELLAPHRRIRVA